jgi:5-methylcytosine-specific restriction enzyme subunit McrC
MKIIQLREQLTNEALPFGDADMASPFIPDGCSVSFRVQRGREVSDCLTLKREQQTVTATSSYFIGIDWIKEYELAVQVNSKMNDTQEINCVKMLNDALMEEDNFEYLKDLLTIHFDKPSIRVPQQYDYLSIFLVIEYLNLLCRITGKGLKKSYYRVEDNLKNKIKGKLLVGQNIRQNIVKGQLTNNVCRYQVYDIDTPENRILKKALQFCVQQLSVYKNKAIDTHYLEHIARFVKPYFSNVGDEVSVKAIKTYKGNPVFREYNQAVAYAQLLLRRYGYNITKVGNLSVETPPYWIDMSKLFELYVYHHLKKVFTAKGEVSYHVRANYQELDYLLKPQLWPEPYVIDAKYKLRYKEYESMIKDDAREVSGYARLTRIYQRLGLPEDALPIKCLIIYPDQDQEETFTFTRVEEPQFKVLPDYIRMFKCGIRLPVI